MKLDDLKRDGLQFLLPGWLWLGLLASLAVGLADGWSADRPPSDLSQTATNKPAPLAPRPSPGRRASLPRAFFKDAPASVDDLKTIEKRVENLVARISPAVVAVEVGGGSGSGVVISWDGLVLCAAHVCGAPGRNVVFTFPDGKTAHGKTLGTNHEMDAGLMKITDAGAWPHVETGELDRARLGDWVLALGHPGGFDPKRPIVVRLGRIILFASNLLQTDCTLIFGDSGGPLFDMHGRVIAIHSRISASNKENFHVPIDAFYDGWVRLAKGENWGGRRSLFSVGAMGVDDTEGCRLDRLVENGPAFKAGLKVGDVVTRVNGQPIKDYLDRARPGDELRLEIQRGNRLMSMMVTAEATRGRGRGRGRFGP